MTFRHFDILSSLFVDLPDARSCVAARVPAEWCVDQPEDCFE